MKGVTKEMDWLPEVCLERYISEGSRDDFSLKNLHTMWSPYSYGACNCFLLISVPDAEQKEGKENSGSFKHTVVAVKIQVLG